MVELCFKYLSQACFAAVLGGLDVILKVYLLHIIDKPNAIPLFIHISVVYI